MARRLLALTLGIAALLLAAPAGASAAANLQAQISGPDPVVAGTNATYTLTVTNIGDADAHTVAVHSSTPGPSRFVSWTGPPSGWTAPAMAPGDTGSFMSSKSTAMAPGASAQFTLVVNVGPGVASGTDVSGTISVSSSPADADPSNNSATAPANVIVRPDLGVTVSAPSTILPSGAFTASYSVTNSGPSDAHDVAVAVPVPDGANTVSFTQNTGPSFTIGFNGANRYTATISTLAAGATATFSQHLTAKATLPDPADIASSARVTTANDDTNPANDAATAVTTEGTRADLVVTNTASPTTADPGDLITYTVTVANRGVDAQNVGLADTLPAGLTFVSGAQADGPAFVCSAAPPAGSDWTCTIATLPARAVAHFTVVARVSSAVARPSTIEATASASTSTTDANPANNSATARIAITAPRGVDLVLKGSAQPARPRRRRLITLIYKVHNAGDVAATDIRFTATLPKAFQFAGAVAARRLCTVRRRKLTCTISRLAAGASARVTVTGTRPKPGSLRIRGTVTSTQPDQNRRDNAATVSLRVRR